MRREQVAAALKYLGDKANLRQRFERATSLDPQEQDLADIAVETAASFVPGVGQALAARDVERARRADDEAGMAMASMGAIPGGRLAKLLKGFDPTRLELDVYHGTPHRFEPTEANPLGEFDASKIGTGEGAQAYGHGVYLAESPKVAEDYRRSTSRSRFLTNDGFFDPSELEHLNVKVKARHGNIDEAIETARKYGVPDEDYPEIAAKAARDLQKLEALKARGGYRENPGVTYKADLPDEMIDRMLDWDKPLSEQRELATPILKELGYLRPNDNGPRQFAEAVKALSLEHGGFGESGATGMGLFNAIYKGLQQGKPKAINLAKRMNLTEQEMFMEASPLASEVMKRMGIPGIRYLDAGSRGQGGSGTRNFVVFPGEEKKVRILERK